MGVSMIDRWVSDNIIKSSFEALDDFVVRFAVGFPRVAGDVEETNESIEAEEEKDRVTVVVVHCTSDQRRD